MTTLSSSSPFLLFGTSIPFLPPPWQTTDDRVRGGSSISHLTAIPSNGARFTGHLDISTLGGAGFASQFSSLEASSSNKTDTDEKHVWDLSAYDGIEILLGKGDGKVYTFILKDELGEGKRGDGRERAGVSWEVEFKGGGEGEGVGRGEERIWVPWERFKATYRGKEVEGEGGVKRGEVRRVGVMMRSYFGEQEGDFSLEIKAITARKQVAGDEERMTSKLV